MVDNSLFEFNKAERQQIKDNLKKRDETLHQFAAKDISAVYNNYEHSDLGYRTNFGTDIDRILYNPFYNRVSDKTQVHSFLKNDDITRRALHMQLVSKIARSIGNVLNLNLELIEAIAIGHDIGHAPFGHKGEDILNKISLSVSKRHFIHNVHSVRVLEKITNNKISLQTLDGIVSHNGVFQSKIVPSNLVDFESFEKKVESCYVEKGFYKTNTANTIEGCLVRICDK
ncbi:MAG: HD domain-containing protein, partial [Firmicutes bacterium]|nr:HD domain-containing protein [Bacillota bacterium]